MRFKQFIAKEDASSAEKGLMVSDKESPLRKPSDGRPFSQYLSSFSGGGPSTGGGSSTGGMMGMKKKMKKKMKAT